MINLIFVNFFSGGWALLIILLGFITVLGILAEKTVYLFSCHQNTPILVVLILKSIAEGNTEDAALVASEARTPMGRILLRGILKAERCEGGIQNAMHEQVAVEFPRLQKRLGLLILIGNACLLVGYLGTINAITSSMRNTQVGALDAPTKTLVDITPTALYCTGAGLTTALFSTLMYFFVSHLERKQEDLILAETWRISNKLRDLREKLLTGKL
jgi:biopolymer transport protein ExbB/TolQ